MQVERWCPPWQPSRDAELVETLNYYDRPLVGIVRQHGVEYLFSCITGHTDHLHSWAYVVLTPDDQERIREASAEQLRGIVDELLSTGPMVIAIASDESGTYGGVEVEGRRGGRPPGPAPDRLRAGDSWLSPSHRHERLSASRDRLTPTIAGEAPKPSHRAERRDAPRPNR